MILFEKISDDLCFLHRNIGKDAKKRFAKIDKGLVATGMLVHFCIVTFLASK